MVILTVTHRKTYIVATSKRRLLRAILNQDIVVREEAYSKLTCREATLGNLAEEVVGLRRDDVELWNLLQLIIE